LVPNYKPEAKERKRMNNPERKIEHKDCQLEVKDFSETGSLTGYLSTFGNIDLGGDRVEAGAFTKTIRENPVKVLLWHHDPSEPAKVVGSFTAKEDARGLFIDADFLPDPDSQNVRTKCRALRERGVTLGLSIGYQVIKHAFETVSGATVRILKELKLNEGSLTLFPMNEMALVRGVKSSDNPEEDDALPDLEPGDSTPDEKPLSEKSEPVDSHLLLAHQVWAAHDEFKRLVASLTVR
jgi:HK97 family phage prohead protease